MTNTINQVAHILEDHDISYSSRTIETILDKWATQKSSLLSLLRQNAAWNEDELCIVFPVTESREIDMNAVNAHKLWLKNMGIDMEDGDDQDFDNFILLLDKACSFGQLVNDKDEADWIKEVYGIKCNVGLKVSKLIGAICRKFRVDKHPSYNKVYAKIADALNPLSVDRKAVLSLHPGDYLLMSNGAGGWDSCHALDSSYKAGTLSYMLDSTSLVFYTVKNEVIENYHTAKKITRQMFHYSDGLLLQSRLYPQDKSKPAISKEISDMYRPLVQKAIADSMQYSNLWTLKRDHADIMQYVETSSGSLHYPDYAYSLYGVTLSLVKDIDRAEEILIGHDSLCLDCGDSIEENDKMHCCSCDEDIERCEHCGEILDEYDRIYVEDCGYYCQDCASYCEECNEGFVGDSHTVHIITNYSCDSTKEVCESCLTDFYDCDHCKEYHVLDLVSIDENGEILCEDCLDQHYHHCADCNEFVFHANNERVTEGKEKENGEWICGNCAEDYSECAHCDKLYLLDALSHDSNEKYLCADCVDSYYYLCSDCDTFIHYEDDNAILGRKENGDLVTCANCLDEDDIDGFISSQAVLTQANQ